MLGIAFLLAGISRRTTGSPAAQSRTWLLVGGIFAAVSTWLFFRS